MSSFLEGFIEHLCIFVPGHRLVAVELAVRIAFDGAVAMERIDGVFSPVSIWYIREGRFLAHIEEIQDPAHLSFHGRHFVRHGLDDLLVFLNLLGQCRARHGLRTGRTELEGDASTKHRIAVAHGAGEVDRRIFIRMVEDAESSCVGILVMAVACGEVQFVVRIEFARMESSKGCCAGADFIDFAGQGLSRTVELAAIDSIMAARSNRPVGYVADLIAVGVDALAVDVVMVVYVEVALDVGIATDAEVLLNDSVASHEDVAVKLRRTGDVEVLANLLAAMDGRIAFDRLIATNGKVLVDVDVAQEVRRPFDGQVFVNGDIALGKDVTFQCRRAFYCEVLTDGSIAVHGDVARKGRVTFNSEILADRNIRASRDIARKGRGAIDREVFADVAVALDVRIAFDRTGTVDSLVAADIRITFDRAGTVDSLVIRDMGIASNRRIVQIRVTGYVEVRRIQLEPVRYPKNRTGKPRMLIQSKW